MKATIARVRLAQELAEKLERANALREAAKKVAADTDTTLVINVAVAEPGRFGTEGLFGFGLKEDDELRQGFAELLSKQAGRMAKELEDQFAEITVSIAAVGDEDE